MRIVQVVLGGLGLAAIAFGLWTLRAVDLSDLVEASLWLAGGVLAHDLLVTPVTLAAAWVAWRVLPRYARGPVAAGFVVLGSLTLMAIPVLGRFGAIPSDPSLLDRDYRAGWLVLAGLVAVGVLLGSVVMRRREVR
ncbi:MAG: hypothetical protein H0U28_00460 [Nocardioidaceae bacterium]|nr:hypothetical protein [Nocardioidaceae bacterium]